MDASYLHGASDSYRGPDVTVRVKRFAPLATLGTHRHDHAYCCLLLRGSAEERQPRRRLELGPASVTIRSPGTEHSVRFGPERALAVIVEVEPSRYASLRRVGFAPSPGVERASPRLCATAATLSAELPLRDRSGELVVEGLALELLGTAIGREPHRAPGTPPKWLVSARERILDAPGSVGSVADLAVEACVHPSYLASAFRRWFGESPGEMLRRRRLEIARDLVLRTSLPLAHIAQRAGYYDQSHFTRDFKKRTGLTPGEWRRISASGRSGR